MKLFKKFFKNMTPKTDLERYIETYATDIEDIERLEKRFWIEQNKAYWRMTDNYKNYF